MELINNSKVFLMVERAMNMVDSRLISHGIHTALVFHDMLRAEGKTDARTMKELIIFALLHDIGACSPQDVHDLVYDNEAKITWEPAIRSYLFLNACFPDSELSKIVLYHHARYRECWNESERVQHYAGMLHLADYVCLWHDLERCSRDEVNKRLRQQAGTEFSAAGIAAFQQADRQFGTFASLSDEYASSRFASGVKLSREEAEACVYLLANVIAFRSHNTAMHTREVMEISLEISRRLGLPEQTQHKIYFGALLHDLGKIGIPLSILEKPGRLTPEEMEIMRSHVLLGWQILEGCVDEEVSLLVLRHHEKLNGTGYPYGISENELTVPQRLLTVADVISALRMSRSYKCAFSKEKCLSIIRSMADGGELDSEIVSLVVHNFDDIVVKAVKRCDPFRRQYEELREKFQKMSAYYQKTY